MKLRLTAALGLSAALVLTACSDSNGTASSSSSSNTSSSASASESTSTTASVPTGLTGTLNGGGASSTVSAHDAWRAEIQGANSGLTINYESLGSGTGRTQFLEGALDFAGSDRAFKLDEITADLIGASKCTADAGIIDVPIYVSPIAIVFNLEGVTDLNLTPEVAAKIFKGEITKWNDEAIAAINEGVELPDMDITAVHRSDKSGTTQNFTDYLNKNASDVWDAEAAEEWPYEGGEAGDKTAGVQTIVAGSAGTIGYLDESAAEGLSVAKLGKDGAFEGPTAEAAGVTLEASPMDTEGRNANDIVVKIDRTAAGYPLMLVSYGIACADYKDDATAELVKGYLGYIVSTEGQQTAADSAGSAPLPAALAEKAAAAIAAIQ